jgi:hypothetical protein
MRTIPTDFLLQFKVEGETYDINGIYLIKSKKHGRLLIVASNSYNWDHVSVSRKLKNGIDKTPNWEAMSFVKDLFFLNNETVIQFHPEKTSYINTHPHVLHLWRSQLYEHKLPPSYLV